MWSVFSRLLLVFVVFQGAAAQADDQPLILVLGDSLSAAYGMETQEGWVTLLEQRLDREGYPHRVVNASISGETSLGGRHRLAELLAAHAPAVLVLELGGNDGLRGLPLTALQDNLRGMARMAREAGARVLLTGMQIPPNLGPMYTERFAAIYPELAREMDLPLIPFLLEGVAGHAALMQDDALHASPAAQPRLLENVWGPLEPLLEKAERRSVADHQDLHQGEQ